MRRRRSRVVAASRLSLRLHPTQRPLRSPSPDSVRCRRGSKTCPLRVVTPLDPRRVMTPLTRQPESSRGGAPRQRRPAVGHGYGVVVVASSTGGPDALGHVLPHWDLHVPVLIVQHMPAEFTKSLAERLDRVCPMPVTEATDGESVEPGRVLIAPGDLHLRVRGTPEHPEVYLSYGPLVNSLR